MDDNTKTTDPVQPENNTNGLSQTDFMDEVQMLYQEMQELDNLYNETKQHVDHIKNASRNRAAVPGGFNFIANQTNQLITLKSAKLNAIKSLIEIKNKQFQNDVKLNEVDQKVNGGASDNDLLKGLINHIINNPEPNIMKRVHIETDGYHPDDDALEQVCEHLEVPPMPELDPEYQTQQVQKEDKKGQTYVVSDEYGNLFEVTLDRRIISEIQDVKATIKLSKEGDIFGYIGDDEVEVLQRQHLLAKQD